MFHICFKVVNSHLWSTDVANEIKNSFSKQSNNKKETKNLMIVIKLMFHVRNDVKEETIIKLSYCVHVETVKT